MTGTDVALLVCGIVVCVAIGIATCALAGHPPRWVVHVVAWCSLRHYKRNERACVGGGCTQMADVLWWVAPARAWMPLCARHSIEATRVAVSLLRTQGCRADVQAHGNMEATTPRAIDRHQPEECDMGSFPSRAAQLVCCAVAREYLPSCAACIREKRKGVQL